MLGSSPGRRHPVRTEERRPHSEMECLRNNGLPTAPGRYLLALMLWWSLPKMEALVVAECRHALGMQSGEILDEFVHSSSAYDASVGAPNARIRIENNGGAWCPKGPVTRDTYEYIEIDMLQLHVITMVETQGRFGNGQGQEFAEEYRLEYQREDEGPWFKFHNRRSQELFRGNTNTYIAELRELNPPMIARRIRFIPHSERPKTVCMRVEVYGCPWKDGLVSYSMRQGEKRGADINLMDLTYDGHHTDHYLHAGLGQLTDGIEGASNFRLDPLGLGIKGYQWVGWRNESLGGLPVEIIFKFDDVRNFTSLRFECNNLFKKDVRVFREADIYFSIAGEYYVTEPVVYRFMRDTLIEYARPIIIGLNNNIGQYVKVMLHFDARWLLISEVMFDSELASGNFTPELPPTTTVPHSTTLGPNMLREIHLISRNNNGSGVANASGQDPAAKTSTGSSVEVYNPKSRRKSDDEIIGMVIGILATLILLLFIFMVIIIIRQRRGKLLKSRAKVLKTVEPQSNGTMNLDEIRDSSANGKLSNGKVYSCVASSDIESDREGTWNRFGNYREPLDSIQHRRLPELPRTPESTDTNTSREYAVPDIGKSSVIVNIPPPPPPPPRRPHNIYGVNPAVPLNVGPYCSTSDVPNIQGVSGNNLYAVPNTEMLWKEDFSVMEFPRDNLKFLEKLGEGQFGEVHLCEAMKIDEFLGDDFLVNRTGSRSMRVVVKMLKKNIDDNIRYNACRFDFNREVKIMCRLKDAHVVRVLGVCSQEDPLCVIVEYMKYGDLNQFLKTHVPENTVARRKGGRSLSYGCIIYMVGQIASGMKYLESLSIVHRDLACRNCLVGPHYTIKISDFGMSRTLYSADYYRIEGKAVLPIRWMAWESVLLGKFSTKTDVWSFGVTLWETLTFARQQPFEDLTDEQVIENCTHFFHGDDHHILLPQPSNCPKEIYDLKRECWNKDEADRPSFKEIHMFLQRKNMGYDPRTEDRSSHNRISVPIV